MGSNKAAYLEHELLKSDQGSALGRKLRQSISGGWTRRIFSLYDDGGRWIILSRRGGDEAAKRFLVNGIEPRKCHVTMVEKPPLFCLRFSTGKGDRFLASPDPAIITAWHAALQRNPPKSASSGKPLPQRLSEGSSDDVRKAEDSPAAASSPSRPSVLHICSLPPRPKLVKYVMYETATTLYVIGSDEREQTFRLVKFDRNVLSPKRLSDIMVVDPASYNREQMCSLLDMIHSGNVGSGGLIRTTRAVAIVGAVRFVSSYYLLLVTQRRRVGTIDGRPIYAIKSTELVPVCDPEKIPKASNAWSRLTRTQSPVGLAEERYRGLFELVDLTKDFYFSYTYDLTRNVQSNVLAATVVQGADTVRPSNRSTGDKCDEAIAARPGTDDTFEWNHYLSREIVDGTGRCSTWSCEWVVPLIQGSFGQQCCSIFGRSMNVTLIARRSRHFAGTRYLKHVVRRGINDQGRVANDVEVEQVVEEQMPEGQQRSVTSYVQMRGSVPTYWMQESSAAIPKPPIKRYRVDPSFSATRLHFEDLLTRYSGPIIVLNLVKQVERQKRECIIGSEFRLAVEYLNALLPKERRIEYWALDFTRLSKSKDPTVLFQALDTAARCSLSHTSYFACRPRRKPLPPYDNATASARVDVQRPHLGRYEEMLRLGIPLSVVRRKMERDGIYTRAASVVGDTSIAAAVNTQRIPMRWSSAKLRFVSITGVPSSLVGARGSAESNRSPLSHTSSMAHLSSLSSPISSGGAHLSSPPDGQHRRSPTEQQLGTPSPGSGKASLHGMESTRKLSFSVLIGARSSLEHGASSGSLHGTQSASVAFGEMRSEWPFAPMLQRGVVRTNCVDCLDRTNAAQFFVGLRAMGQQLHTMGMLSEPRLEPGSQLVVLLMEMYETMGDRIAQQYGGSGAHKKGSKLMSKTSLVAKQMELLTTMQRYYSNSFTDRAKQDAMNLFLGAFDTAVAADAVTAASGMGPAHVWDLESDFYLHNSRVKQDPSICMQPVTDFGDWWVPPLHSYDMKRRAFVGTDAGDSFEAEKSSKSAHIGSVDEEEHDVVDGVGVEGTEDKKRISRRSGRRNRDVYEPATPSEFVAMSRMTSFDSLLREDYSKPREIFFSATSAQPESTPNDTSSTASMARAPDTLQSHQSVITDPESLNELAGEGSMGTRPRDFSTPGLRQTLRGGLSTAMRAAFSPLGLGSSLFGEENHKRLRDATFSSRKCSSADLGIDGSAKGVPELDGKSLQSFKAYTDLVARPELIASKNYGDAAERSKQFEAYMADFSLTENDAWGMRRLQAHAGATTILVSGIYKGLPQSLPAISLLSDDVSAATPWRWPPVDAVGLAEAETSRKRLQEVFLRAVSTSQII